MDSEILRYEEIQCIAFGIFKFDPTLSLGPHKDQDGIIHVCGVEMGFRDSDFKYNGCIYAYNENEKHNCNQHSWQARYKVRCYYSAIYILYHGQNQESFFRDPLDSTRGLGCLRMGRIVTGVCWYHAQRNLRQAIQYCLDKYASVGITSKNIVVNHYLTRNDGICEGKRCFTKTFAEVGLSPLEVPEEKNNQIFRPVDTEEEKQKTYEACKDGIKFGPPNPKLVAREKQWELEYQKYALKQKEENAQRCVESYIRNTFDPNPSKRRLIKPEDYDDFPEDCREFFETRGAFEDFEDEKKLWEEYFALLPRSKFGCSNLQFFAEACEDMATKLQRIPSVMLHLIVPKIRLNLSEQKERDPSITGSLVWRIFFSPEADKYVEQLASKNTTRIDK